MLPYVVDMSDFNKTNKKKIDRERDIIKFLFRVPQMRKC